MQRKAKSIWIQMDQGQALIDFRIQDQTLLFHKQASGEKCLFKLGLYCIKGIEKDIYDFSV